MVYTWTHIHVHAHACTNTSTNKVFIKFAILGKYSPSLSKDLVIRDFAKHLGRCSEIRCMQGSITEASREAWFNSSRLGNTQRHNLREEEIAEVGVIKDGLEI